LIRKISNKIEGLHRKDKFDKNLLDFLKECINFRGINHFETNFRKLGCKYILYLFSLISKGDLHKKMNYYELNNFLSSSFKGFPNLMQIAKKIKNIYYGKKYQ